MFFFVILFGCDNTSTDTYDPLSDSPVDECNTLDENQCNDSSECYPIYARSLTEIDYGYCYDPDNIWEQEEEWIICQSSVSSIQVETVAGPEDSSECFLFPTGTIPTGWVEDCNTTIGLQCDD